MKNNVRQFYDQVGWSQVGEGIYQNARYEDLRPVSQEYLHRCHMRVKRFLRPEGRYLLDAGSGPIQYPEYLTYSEGYRYRVCADISPIALQEARTRIGAHGLFVVADVANLPFKRDVFAGVVTLHTLHHLPEEEHLRAYRGLHRVLAPGHAAVVVNGWNYSPLMEFFRKLLRLRKRMWLLARRLWGRASPAGSRKEAKKTGGADPIGTFVQKHNPAWLKREVAAEMDLEIRVWRTVNVRFLRNFVFEKTGGRALLRVVYWLEERFPHFLGERGSYPLIVIRKDAGRQAGR